MTDISSFMAADAIAAPPPVNPPAFVARHHNLASPTMGARVVFASDQFFADSGRMLADAAAVFYPDRYDDHGKWMDGWETRRRRHGGNDFAIIRLGARGVIRGFNIDTHFFTGNFPPAAMVEGALVSDDADGDWEKIKWQPLLSTMKLTGNNHNFFAIDNEHEFNILKLSIFPDGGVARFRVYGEPKCDWQAKKNHDDIELSALKYGGRIIGYNDAHYGHVESLIAEGRAANMGDGWETRRRREPGHDWLILALAHPGIIDRVEVDTAHYKGNYPDSCSLQAAMVEHATDNSLVAAAMFWPELLPPQKLQADHIHQFDKKLLTLKTPVSHVRLNIFPDGGVSRLRLFGRMP